VAPDRLPRTDARPPSEVITTCPSAMPRGSRASRSCSMFLPLSPSVLPTLVRVRPRRCAVVTRLARSSSGAESKSPRPAAYFRSWPSTQSGLVVSPDPALSSLQLISEAWQYGRLLVLESRVVARKRLPSSCKKIRACCARASAAASRNNPRDVPDVSENGELVGCVSRRPRSGSGAAVRSTCLGGGRESTPSRVPVL